MYVYFYELLSDNCQTEKFCSWIVDCVVEKDEGVERCDEQRLCVLSLCFYWHRCNNWTSDSIPLPVLLVTSNLFLKRKIVELYFVLLIRMYFLILLRIAERILQGCLFSFVVTALFIASTPSKQVSLISLILKKRKKPMEQNGWIGWLFQYCDVLGQELLDAQSIVSRYIVVCNVTWSTTERREIRNFPYPSVFELTGCQRQTVKKRNRNVGQFLTAEVTNPGHNESQQMFALCVRMDKERDILDI